MTNRGPFNHYVVQSQHDVSQFSELWTARKHAELNRPATVWNGRDVTEIQDKVLAYRADATPIETVW